MRMSNADLRSSSRSASAPSSMRSDSADSSIASGLGPQSVREKSSAGSGIGLSRRFLRICSRKTIRAIPKSQPCSLPVCSSVPSLRCARTNVSCVPSSAAASSRSRSPRNLRTPGACRSKITRNASASPAHARDSSSSSECLSRALSTSPCSDAMRTAVSTARRCCYVTGMDVVVTSGSGLEQQIRVGRHQLVSDEPVESGGADGGPSPYELLAAALGSCTSMTLRLYARVKGWPLQRVIVTIRHDKIYARDCAECETREGRIDRLEREIVLEGPLEEAQKERLLEIAERCPVHRTLTREMEMVTRLKKT